MVLVYIGETPSRDATPNETVSVLSELARQSSAAAGGDPRACWTPQDMMRQSRSSHDSRRIILAWFEGDVSGAPVTEDGVPVLAVAEEGIGIYSEYVAPMPVPDEVIDSGKVDGRVTAFAAVSCSLTSRASQATIFLMPFDLDGEVAEILVAAAEDVARSWGRTELTLVLDEVRGDEIPCEVSQMSVASSPANEAARRRGWHLAQVTRCSGAAIPPADWLADRAIVTSDAYRLETFIDVIPDELLPSFLKVVNSMGTDAPSAGFEAEEFGVTEEKWRQGEKLLMKDGTESILTLALHGHDVVGYTELVVKPGRPVGQGDTIVARDHRGHGLGMSMKARNLEVLSERHPHEEWVYTWNAGENAFMLHINDQIGFEIQNIGGLWQKKLNGSGSLE